MRYFVGIDLSSWKRGTAHVLSVQNMVSRNTGKKMNVNETKRLSELEIKKLFSDEHLIMASQSDKAVIDFFNERIDRIEKAVLKEVKLRYPYEELLTAPGVGENMWFCNMLGIDVSAPPLPEKETRLEFIKRYAEDSGKRLASLKEKNDAWWEEEVNFFNVKRSRAWIVTRRIAHTAHHRGQMTMFLRMMGREIYSTYGPSADTGGLMQNKAATIYPYTSIEALIDGETAGGNNKATLPGPDDKPCTERPDLK